MKVCISSCIAISSFAVIGKTPAVTSITSCSTFVDTLIGTSVSLFVVLALLTFSIIINIYCFIR